MTFSWWWIVLSSHCRQRLFFFENINRVVKKWNLNRRVTPSVKQFLWINNFPYKPCLLSPLNSPQRLHPQFIAKKIYGNTFIPFQAKTRLAYVCPTIIVWACQMEERSRSCHWQHRPHHWRRMASANTQNQRKKRKTGHHLRPPATSTLGLGLNGQRWNTFSPVSCATRCKRSLPSAGHFPGCKVCPS